VNGIYFGNDGELYINVGSNTNGGIPGELSRNLLMSENYFSAAILVANMGRPTFNGFITYDAKNNGNPVNGTGPNGVEVFASGLRNSYGIVLHSNGKLYATENGPNPGFGDMATGCGPGQYVPDKYDSDELNLIVRNGWYGHPNHQRARTDPRQCVWKGTADLSTSEYTAPLMKLRSSTDGIIEYDSNHFNGEIRHNLIASKYKNGLYRIVLSADGNSVVPTSIPAIELTGDGGLAVTMAPNGNLLDTRLETGAVYMYRPLEPLSTLLTIYNVFPRRGGLAGGSILSIYGRNFVGTQIVVFVGTSLCTNPIISESYTMIRCQLPPSTVVGRKDVVVENENGVRDIFALAYNYIRGTQ
jgi:Glucose / Sorbosone dehydrogenase/IPT/TIG domain